MTRDNILNLATISEIEALPDTRPLRSLYRAELLGRARSASRVGQAGPPTRNSSTGEEPTTFFVNGTFGWPAIKANNLPAGGPAPPIAVMGARLKAKLSDRVTAFAAIFNGNAAGPGERATRNCATTTGPGVFGC